MQVSQTVFLGLFIHPFASLENKEYRLRCHLYWLLHQAYNKRSGESHEFVAPGTHGTFYPWYPPPGLPLHILTSLHEALLKESKTMGLTHS